MKVRGREMNMFKNSPSLPCKELKILFTSYDHSSPMRQKREGGKVLEEESEPRAAERPAQGHWLIQTFLRGENVKTHICIACCGILSTRYMFSTYLWTS